MMLFQTNDTEALNIVFDLIEKQKIILGGSSGINIAAIKLMKLMGPGKTIVTILVITERDMQVKFLIRNSKR